MRQQKNIYITLIHQCNEETKALKPTFISSKFKNHFGVSNFRFTTVRDPYTVSEEKEREIGTPKSNSAMRECDIYLLTNL